MGGTPALVGLVRRFGAVFRTAGDDEFAGLEAAFAGHGGQFVPQWLARGRGRRRRPVSAEAMAAITLAAIANPKATPRPLWNGAVIRCGKNCRPVT